MTSHQMTYKEVLSKTRADENRSIFSSLPIYILVENQPRHGCPEYVEMACLRQNGVEGIMCYLSLVDAMIDLQGRNKAGRFYEIRPLEAIDPQIFLDQHKGWLTVFLVYGFAAEHGKVWGDEGGQPVPFGKMLHFQLGTDNEAKQFTLEFGGELAQWLARLHERAEIYDHADTHCDLEQMSHDELDRCAKEAVRRMPQAPRGTGAVLQCALYDPLEQEWRFVAVTNASNHLAA